MCLRVLRRRLLLAMACAGLIAGFSRDVPGPAAYAMTDQDPPPVPAVLDFKMKSLAGLDVHLSRYHGDVVLIVNTASRCGRTPQYEQLQQLHEDYAEQGLSVLGFPANNFGKQEPGSNNDIAAFCEQNYGVAFDMFAKISVKGPDQAPLYRYLTSKKTNPTFGGEIKWNFDKFLISRDGTVVARFASKTRPDAERVIESIRTELAKPSPVVAGDAE